MSIITCGVNYKTAPLTLRERISVAETALPLSLNLLKNRLLVPEIAILSTCNRTEYYCTETSVGQLSECLKEQYQITSKELEQYFYAYHDVDAVRHMMHVACGLDSMILGETQVLGQMKRAYQIAKEAGTIGKCLNQLFQYIFAITKQVRRNTDIGASPVSLAYAAVDLAKHIFAHLTDAKVMLLGAGETIELVARYCQRHQVDTLRIFNRTYNNAKVLAETVAGEAYRLVDIPLFIADSDIIVSAVGANIPLITQTMVERALKIRKHKPILMVDLAMPRDFDPKINEMADVYFYTLDTLHTTIANNAKKRRQNALEAKHWIELHVEHYMRRLDSLNAVKLIENIRKKMETARDFSVRKALDAISQGESTAAVLVTLAHELTNKFLHQPTVQIRQASFDGQWHLLELLKKVYGLSDA